MVEVKSEHGQCDVGVASALMMLAVFEAASPIDPLNGEEISTCDGLGGVLHSHSQASNSLSIVCFKCH